MNEDIYHRNIPWAYTLAWLCLLIKVCRPTWPRSSKGQRSVFSFGQTADQLSFQKMLFFTNCKRFSDIARARRECSRHLKRCQCVPTFWFSSLTSPPATPCLPYSLSNATIDPYLHTRPLAVTPEPDCPPKRIITASQTGGNRILLL